MTKAEIITDIQNMIGPSSGIDGSVLTNWVNDAYAQIINAITEANPDYFVKSSTTSLVADQQEYPLPTDFERMTAVNLLLSGTWTRALPMGDADLRYVPALARSTSDSQGFSTASPKYYIYNDVLGLMPVPTESTSSALRIWYVYTPAELSDDTDEPDIPSRFHHLLKFWAYANFLDRDEEHVSAERSRQRFDREMQKLIDTISDKQNDEVKRVQISQNRDLYSNRNIMSY